MKSAIFFTLLFISTLAHAGEWKFSTNAEANLDALYWASGTLGPDNKQIRPIINLKTPTTLRYGRGFRFRFLPLLQSDPQNVSKRERFYWDPQEAYMQWQNLPWTVQAGFNVFQWGQTDVFNPLDVVNPRVYFDPLRSEKLGSAAVLVKRDFDDFFVEAIYIPVQRKTLLPGEKSRWLPRDIYKSRSVGTGFGAGRILLPSNLNYQYMEPLELDQALKNNFGARMKFRFSGFDWTIAGFQGTAVSPAVNLRQITATATTLLPELTFVVDPDVYLQAAYYKTRMLGTSFTLVLGDFLLKGASAENKPVSKRSDLPVKTWENVLGLERTFAWGAQSLTVLAQGTYVDRADHLDTNSVSLARMFDRAGMLGFRWAPSEKVTALLSYLRDIRFKGNLYHGEASYKLADGWKVKAAGDVLSGATETPIGTSGKNDRATLSLNVQW